MVCRSFRGNSVRGIQPSPWVRKKFLHKIHPLYGKGPAIEVLQNARRAGKGKGELVGPQGLIAAAIALVIPLPAIFAVPQKGVTRVGKLGANLVGAPGEIGRASCRERVLPPV